MKFKPGDIIEVLGITQGGLTLIAHADPSCTFQIGDFGIVEKLLWMSKYLHIRHLRSDDRDLLMMYDARLYCSERWVWD